MASRHDNNGTVSHRPLTRVESKRLLKAALIDPADNSNQQSQQDESASDSSPMEPPRQEVAKRCRERIASQYKSKLKFYVKCKK